MSKNFQSEAFIAREDGKLVQVMPDTSKEYEKGYGYLIVIDGCPENEFSKDIKNMGDSIIKKRTVKEESEYYNDLL